MKFTEQQLQHFEAFKKVQRTGLYNMLDSKAVRATGLTVEQYEFVIHNYEELEKEAEPE